jgi:transcriptional regulator with XRE-family HTH domain
VPYSSELLRRLLVPPTTQYELAAKLSMTPAHFSRVLRGGRLSVTSCLRLADQLQIAPSVVLRAYDYTEEAAILDRAYPTRGLTSAQERLLRELTSALSAARTAADALRREQPTTKPPRRAKR